MSLNAVQGLGFMITKSLDKQMKFQKRFVTGVISEPISKLEMAELIITNT